MTGIGIRVGAGVNGIEDSFAIRARLRNSPHPFPQTFPPLTPPPLPFPHIYPSHTLALPTPALPHTYPLHTLLSSLFSFDTPWPFCAPPPNHHHHHHHHKRGCMNSTASLSDSPPPPGPNPSRTVLLLPSPPSPPSTHPRCYPARAAPIRRAAGERRETMRVCVLEIRNFTS